MTCKRKKCAEVAEVDSTAQLQARDQSMLILEYELCSLW